MSVKKDVFGRIANTGDMIAYSVRRYSSMQMKYGTVTRMDSKGSLYVESVQPAKWWDKNSKPYTKNVVLSNPVFVILKKPWDM